MAKHDSLLGKLFGLAVLGGAAAAGYSYYKQYKEFHKDLEKDFKDFEDEDIFADDEEIAPQKARYSCPISEEKRAAFMAKAKVAFEAAKDLANSGVDIAKDAGKVISDKSSDFYAEGLNKAYDWREKAEDFKIDGAYKAADIIEKAKAKVQEAQAKIDELYAAKEAAEEELAKAEAEVADATEGSEDIQDSGIVIEEAE